MHKQAQHGRHVTCACDLGMRPFKLTHCRMQSAERLVMGFGSRTTAAQVLEGVDLTGKTAVVTGGNSGA